MSTELPEKLNFYVSPTGTGKTYRMLEKIDKNPDEPFVVLYPRTSQISQFVGRSGLRHYEDVTDLSTFGESIVITVDSFHKLDPDRYKDCIILDETGLTREQVVGKTNEKNPKHTLLQFKLFLAAASEVHVLESNMTDHSIRFVQLAAEARDENLWIEVNEPERSEGMGTAYRCPSENALKAKLLEPVRVGKK